MSDLISRQAAIDAFNTNLNELVVGGEENAKTVENYLNRVLDKIKYLPSALGTNLAEVGTDTISRQAAFDALNHELRCGAVIDQCGLEVAYEVIEDLPPAEPQIIRCKDCKHYKYGMCMKICASKSTNGFCDWGERKEVTT